MQYIQLKTLLAKFVIFSLTDIKKIYPEFHRRRLNEWQDKGYIKKIIKGYYVFTDLSLNENIFFYIANKIYSPSYVSLEMALSYYNLIPEGVYKITSVSTRRTYDFKTGIAEFSYRALNPKIFFGYELIKYNDKCFKIATVEKALLDYFYLNVNLNEEDDFRSLRFNKEVFLKKIDKETINGYLKKINQKKLTKRINKLWEVMNSD